MVIKIPVQYIIEIGLLRKRGKCALCSKDVDVPNHNIQLCMECRKVELDKYALRNMKEVRK